MDQPDIFEGDEPELASLAEGERHSLTVAEADNGLRIDRLLAARLAPLSRTRIQRLVTDGQVLNGARVVGDAAERVNAGDTLTITLPPPEQAEPLPEAIPLTIVHEDAALIVIDKPAGLVVHPAPGNWSGTLVNALLHHCGESLSGIGGVRRPGIVHRLDKETSGVLVVAKTDKAHRGLSAQFADHGRTGHLERAYLAFVWGVPGHKGVVNAPIDRHPGSRVKMSVRNAGREAITHWTLLETYPDVTGTPIASLVECRLETGRTHQIRVHMAHIGHPLVADEVYGQGFKTKLSKLPPRARAAVEALGRQALHAARLGFEHPVTHEVLSFDSPLPPELETLRDALAGT